MFPVGVDLYWKDSARLADGREIIYYDESPGLGRAKAPDRRPLGHRPRGTGEADGPDPPPSGLRWDALAGEWVIIAAQRQDRTFLPPPGECVPPEPGGGRLLGVAAGPVRRTGPVRPVAEGPQIRCLGPAEPG